jgi:hypothetical protein
LPRGLLAHIGHQVAPTDEDLRYAGREGGARGVWVGGRGEGYGARGERVAWREDVGRPSGRQGTPIPALTLGSTPILALRYY